MRKIYLVLAGLSLLTCCHANTNEEKGNASAAGVKTAQEKIKESSPVKKQFNGLETVGLPDNIPSQIKEYEGFTVSFNKENRTPNYVAWELLHSETTGAHNRRDKFWHDDEIEGCPFDYDYRGSGFDRGHICPAADQKWSEQAMAECFVFSNICPQDHALNAGAWGTLEKKERQWAQRDSVIYIVAGPIYTAADKQRIGDTGVRVPSAFFKVFLAPYVESPRGIGFVYPNSTAPGNMQNYSMSIDDVEQITGFDFFPSLPDDIENAVEAQASFRDWNKNSKK